MTPVSYGKPCARNPLARFEEGASAPEKPRRNALLHDEKCSSVVQAASDAVALIRTALPKEQKEERVFALPCDVRGKVFTKPKP